MKRTTKPTLRLTSLLLCFFLLGTNILRAHADPVPVYQDPHAPLAARVDDLFNRLTPDERLTLLTGTGFTSCGVARVGLPPITMADAGQGVRGGMDSLNGPATAFPAGILLAASWDPTVAHEVGAAIGVEAQNKGTGAQVLLAPGVNIHRTPLNGRYGEYYSEDPYLAAQTAVGYIQGVESTGAGACVKHFLCNDQEYDRSGVDVEVGERALREIYLPPFQAAVERGHVWAVMSSYNKVNGLHSSANWYLLTDILKDDWGFDGLVMSDWGGVHETVGVLNAGNDLEMPGPGQLNHDAVAACLAAGLVKQAKVDDAVRRLLRTAIRAGLLDGPRTLDHSLMNSEEHKQVAYRAALAGMVLLKNDRGILLRLTEAYFRPIRGMGARNPMPTPRSLTTGKPTIASSEKQGNLAKYATDGDSRTRWEWDWSDPQWVAVDLGKPEKISRALLMWEAARASSYKFQVSEDGKTWTQVYSSDKAQGAFDAFRFAPVTARWVRVYGTKRATGFGYSLYELDVYGK